MLSLSVFNICEPDDSDTEKFGIYTGGIQFLKTSDGVKWYDVQKEFASSTYKITYKSTGEITAIDKDASKLFPLNQCVLEVETLPDDFAPEKVKTGEWKIVDGQITYSPRTSEVVNE